VLGRLRRVRRRQGQWHASNRAALRLSLGGYPARYDSRLRTQGEASRERQDADRHQSCPSCLGARCYEQWAEAPVTMPGRSLVAGADLSSRVSCRGGGVLGRRARRSLSNLALEWDSSAGPRMHAGCVRLRRRAVIAASSARVFPAMRVKEVHGCLGPRLLVESRSARCGELARPRAAQKLERFLKQLRPDGVRQACEGEASRSEAARTRTRISVREQSLSADLRQRLASLQARAADIRGYL